MKKKKEAQAFDFEKGMTRLNEIINQFDEGGLSLDEMEKYFGEGMELIQNCSKRLDQFEAKVTHLLEQFEEEIPNPDADEFEEEGLEE